MPPVRINYYSITKSSKKEKTNKKDADKDEFDDASGSKDSKLEVSNLNNYKKIQVKNLVGLL